MSALDPDGGAVVWMRCPYDADLCGADAMLTEFTTDNLDAWWETAWSGRLECVNGHVFRIGQEVSDGGSET